MIKSGRPRYMYYMIDLFLLLCRPGTPVSSKTQAGRETNSARDKVSFREKPKLLYQAYLDELIAGSGLLHNNGRPHS